MPILLTDKHTYTYRHTHTHTHTPTHRNTHTYKHTPTHTGTHPHTQTHNSLILQHVLPPAHFSSYQFNPILLRTVIERKNTFFNEIINIYIYLGYKQVINRCWNVYWSRPFLSGATHGIVQVNLKVC